MALTITAEDMQAFGKQLLDLTIASYQGAKAAHALTQDVPAPATHPLVSTIVDQFGGEYTVIPVNAQAPSATDTLSNRMDAVERLVALQTRAVVMENALGIKVPADATIEDRIAAIEAAATSTVSVAAAVPAVP